MVDGPEAYTLTVYVARHGRIRPAEPGALADPRWAIEDPRLLPAGRRMAESLGLRLTGMNPVPERIAASPLWRTSETAQLVAEALGLHFSVEPGLMELCLPAMHRIFHGLDATEAALVFSRMNNPELLRERWWPAAPETPADCQARVVRTLEALVPQWQAARVRAVLVVGHGASVDAAVAHLAGLPACPAGHDLCGLSKVTLSSAARSGTLEFVNCTKHLAPNCATAGR